MAMKLLKLPCFFYPMSPNFSIFPIKSSVCNLKSAIHCSIKDQRLHSAYERRFSNYQPSLWSYEFLQSLQNDNADDVHKEKAKQLEEEVRCLIKNKNGSDEEIIKKLELIDDIQRLGMRFLFEDEIKEGLDNIILDCGGGLSNLKSLHSTSLFFRLLRQHGYPISQDVLKEFMDEKGEIVEWLRKDWKGILSLYEASLMGMEGEDVLDKARKQTFLHLNDVPKNDIISHALELPLNSRMVMLEARWHIEAYTKREHPNDSILQLAILNFNMIQALLQTELKEMSMWWNKLELAKQLGFSRDRLMECFFWAVGIMYEPQFSSCRKVLTKVASFVTTIDDVYDVYGTLDELGLFTLAVQRWDVNGVKNMPDYMKLSYLSLYNTVNEIAYDTLKQQNQYVLPYLTKAWGDLCKSFLKEAKWRHEKHIPSFDEYLENGCVSVSGIVFIIHAYFLMDHNNSNPNVIHCLQNHHELLRTSALIFRLCNDLATSSDEIGRGEVVNAIWCYMNENGVSEEEARKHIKELIEKAWKKMNKFKLDETPNYFPVQLIETAINLARIAQCTYQHGDGHGSPDSTSHNRVLTLIIQPISSN